jgi:coenzyme F420-reducing hydrogenase alpha subunit
MTPDAELMVRLHCTNRHVAAVSVESSRRALPSKLVLDRPPAEVAQLVPRLFSICSRAQGAAAAGALEAAQGLSLDGDVAERRHIAVALEALQESLWRLLIDWPEALDEPPLVAPLRVVRQAAADVERGHLTIDALLAEIERVASEHVYAQSSASWLAQHPDSLDQWIATAGTLPARLVRRLQSEMPGLGRSDVPLMPPATLAALETALLPYLQRDAGYALAPHWDGVPVETGALARQSGHPLVAAFVAREGRTAAARFVARLVELAASIDALRSQPRNAVRQHKLRTGEGIGLAETARGLLLHRARVDDGHVVDFQIVAPTEWNFHPEGGIRSLTGRPAHDDRRLESEARLVVRSLDPCVACRVEIAHA